MTMRTLTRLAGAAFVVTSIACHKAEPPAEPVAPVQVAPAIKGSIRLIINADAVLFPRDQANIMPKISAPVRRFLVNRGDHVKQGQLLAELENRDLLASAQAAKGQFEQAQSNYHTTAAATVPEAVTKAQADVDAAKEALDASRKLLESRQQLFKEGATPRKTVDEAQVQFAQAKANYDTALQHMQALQSVRAGNRQVRGVRALRAGLAGRRPGTAAVGAVRHAGGHRPHQRVRRIDQARPVPGEPVAEQLVQDGARGGVTDVAVPVGEHEGAGLQAAVQRLGARYRAQVGALQDVERFTDRRAAA